MKPLSEQRKERLAAALRANLRRRKASAGPLQNRRAPARNAHVPRTEKVPPDSPAGR
jgi:hypothetical protein